MKNVAITQLNKSYSKRFNTLISENFGEKDLGLTFFVEYLEYMRDQIIVKNVLDIEQEPLKTTLATITTAIAEFYAYLQTNDKEQKMFHWKTFCDFTKLNMEEWLALYDSV